MHRFAAPAEPNGFAAHVSAQRDAVEAAVKKKKKPEFPPKWSDFKDALSSAQHRKCGFCEAKVVGVAFGDVEHYSPKSEVEELPNNPDLWGREVANLATTVGRKPATVAALGYWWRAYEWENYLLACTICNQQWKKAIFPVRERPRPIPPKPRAKETALLLNPFRGPHPKDHLEFGRHGEVSPRANSEYGLETIKTCGLDRPSLREFRLAIARRTHRRIDDLKNLAGPELDRVLRDICDDGAETEPHCGMVRAMYEQRTGTSWAELEALVKS